MHSSVGRISSRNKRWFSCIFNGTHSLDLCIIEFHQMLCKLHSLLHFYFIHLNQKLDDKKKIIKSSKNKNCTIECCKIKAKLPVITTANHNKGKKSFNPLTPRSDSHVSSPYHIHPLSSKQVMRILKCIK